jgi:hypothetical protein
LIRLATGRSPTFSVKTRLVAGLRGKGNYRFGPSGARRTPATPAPPQRSLS